MTYHGLALNVVTDLHPFEWIVPCGIHDRDVGSIQSLLTSEGKDFEEAYLIERYRSALLNAFEDVFETELLIPSHESRSYWQ